MTTETQYQKFFDILVQRLILESDEEAVHWDTVLAAIKEKWPEVKDYIANEWRKSRLAREVLSQDLKGYLRLGNPKEFSKEVKPSNKYL